MCVANYVFTCDTFFFDFRGNISSILIDSHSINCSTCQQIIKFPGKLQNQLFLNSSRFLWFHDRKMSPRKMLHCDECGYTTDRRSNLTAHNLRKHVGPEGYPYLCIGCDLRCASLQDVNRHQLAAHPGKKIPKG